MKKYLANIITCLRIIGSVALLFFPAFSLGFYIIYLLCGISDMIDGTIARRTNSVSSFGSKLDSVSDFVFMVICSIKLLPLIQLPTLIWVWIAVITVIKVANIALGFVYEKKFVDFHTVFNKATGLMLFLLPLTLQLVEATYSFMAVCIMATIASVQECFYIIKGKNK